MTDLTQSTTLLDYDNPAIQALIHNRGWRHLNAHDRIGAAYDFVRNDIAFGYQAADAIPASQVLADGYGQCNTKGILLMALLRALDIPCRMRGLTIAKSLQRGVVPELVYHLAPGEILHSWVELNHQERWITLEGFILDRPFLGALQSRFSGGGLCAYGVGTDCLQSPPVDWTGADTFIQKTGVVQDFGTFETPDALFSIHGQTFGPLRRFLYAHVVRHWMNARVGAIRAGRIPGIPGGPDGAPTPAQSVKGRSDAA